MTISQAPHCLEELELTSTVSSYDCIVFKGDSIYFRLEMAIPMKHIPAKKAQATHLQLVNKKPFPKYTRILNHLSNGSILKTQHLPNNVVRLDLIDSTAAIIWSRDSIHSITNTTFINESGNVLYLNYYEEFDKHIQKINLLSGELIWDKQLPAQIDRIDGFKRIKSDSANNLYLTSEIDQIISPEGKLIWVSEPIENGFSQVFMPLKNGQLMSAGYHPKEKNGQHSFAYKIYDKDYQIIKQEAFFKEASGQVADIRSCTNGDYLLVGNLFFKKKETKKQYHTSAVLRLNENFELIWSQILDNQLRYLSDDLYKGAFERADGSILIISYNKETGNGLYSFGSDDIYIACLEPDGQMRWQQTIGSPNADFIDFADYKDGKLVLGYNDAYWEYRLLD